MPMGKKMPDENDDAGGCTGWEKRKASKAQPRRQSANANPH
jgi:hypothetical protein